MCYCFQAAWGQALPVCSRHSTTVSQSQIWQLCLGQKNLFEKLDKLHVSVTTELSIVHWNHYQKWLLIDSCVDNTSIWPYVVIEKIHVFVQKCVLPQVEASSQYLHKQSSAWINMNNRQSASKYSFEWKVLAWSLSQTPGSQQESSHGLQWALYHALYS